LPGADIGQASAGWLGGRWAAHQLEHAVFYPAALKARFSVC
jgi:hypothetical protein